MSHILSRYTPSAVSHHNYNIFFDLFDTNIDLYFIFGI
jgi:hypothetical protein